MRPLDPDIRRRIRLLSLSARSSEAPALALGRGLNVLMGVPEADVGLLRSAFSALTGAGGTPLEVLVDLDGTVMSLDEGFARTLGLDGLDPPVLDVPPMGSPGGTATSGAAGRRNAAPVRSAPRQRMAELAAHERALRSELELTRRELGRELELSRSTVHADGGAHAELHPADVAVMCDRLRELLVSEGAGKVADLLERLDEHNRDRVYGIFREEALGQLAAECGAAISSAREYLESLGEPAERSDPGTSRIEAHTIARIELLEEFAGFLDQRSAEVAAALANGEDLLREANDVLTEAGHKPVDTLSNAVVELERLTARSEADEQAAAELVATLAAWLDVPVDRKGGVVSDAARLLVAAEERLAGGAVPRPGGTAGRSWPDADRERLVELEATEQRLVSRLDAVSHELASLRRGLDALERSAPASAQPNPFGGAHDTGVSDPTGIAGERWSLGQRWSLPEELAALRDVPGAPLLPVLLVEPPGGDHRLSRIDPLSVAALAIGGQLLWITDRESVPAALGVLGDDVELIRV